MKILLVENHADTARAMSILLTRNGHAVKIADSIATALDSAQKSNVELLICDLGLPDGDGRELLGRLRQTHNIPSICVSGQSSSADIQQSKAAGFLAHLPKPVDMERLGSLIQELAAPTPAVRARQEIRNSSIRTA
jgi:CheY-like chemotaxis protein